MAAKAEAGENWPWTQPDALEELPLPVAPLDPLLPVAPPVLELAMLPPPPPHAPSSATAGINVTANTDLRKAIIVDILSKRGRVSNVTRCREGAEPLPGRWAIAQYANHLRHS
jgi:hypothetical protein